MRRKFCLISAVLGVIFLLPLAGRAATVSSADLYGGYVEDVAIDSVNSYGWVALNAPNGLYYTSDFSTWQALPSGSDYGNCIAVEVSTNYTYAICGINVYRTTDGGSWEILEAENVGQRMHYGGTRLFLVMREMSANNYTTLAISEDEGGTFTTGIEVFGAEMIEALAASGDTVYALGGLASGYGLFRSVDGGATWSNTSSTFSAEPNMSLAVSPNNSQYVAVQAGDSAYLSINGGSSFSAMTPNPAGQVLFVGDRLYCGLNYTDNLGTTWGQLDPGSLALGRNYLAISGAKMLAATAIGVAVSSDSGATWAETTEGIEALEVSDIAQDPDNKDNVMLALHGGLAMTDGYTGANPTWTFNTSYETATAVYYGSDILITGFWWDIYYSEDGGATWTASGQNIGQVKTIIKNNGIYYAGYDGGVYYSADGKAWTDFGLSGVTVNSLTGTSNGKLYAAVGEEFDDTAANAGIYKYDSSAWTQVVTEGLYNDVIVADNDLGNNIVYAASGETDSGGVIRSADYGTSWDDLTANGLATDGWYHRIITQDNDENVLYVSTARPSGTGTIYKSMDGGENWGLYYTGLKDQTFKDMLFDGLMVASNIGLDEMYSQAKVNILRSKKAVPAGTRVRLSVTLEDKATKEVLGDKPVRLYKKYKNGSWKLVKNKKTNSKGKASFYQIINKKTWFKAKWTAKKRALIRAYGGSAHVSKAVTVKMK